MDKGVSPSELRSKDGCRKAGEWGRFQAWSTWTDPHWPGSQLWTASVWGDVVYLLQYWENQDNTLPPQEWWHSWVDEPYITGHTGQVRLWVPAWLGCSPAFGYDGIQVQCPLIDSIYATLSFVWSRGTTTLKISCMVASHISRKQPRNMLGTLGPPWMRPMKKPKSIWRLPRKDRKTTTIAELPGRSYKMVGDHMCLYVPVIKTGKKLHSPWQGQHVMVKTISDMTFQVEEVGNHRKRKVVHFNRLKLYGEPLSTDQYSYQPTGHCFSSPVWRPHLPPRYTPDETDLMYIDETATEGNNKSNNGKLSRRIFVHLSTGEDGGGSVMWCRRLVTT